MHKRLERIRSIFSGPVWIRWFVILGSVWVLLAILYAIATVQSQRSRHRLMQDGVAQVEAFAEKAGLPLLEQDIKALRAMLETLGERQDVLYASVIDHKNKIIAYTDAGRLLNQHPVDVETVQGVQFWSDNGTLVFAKPIMFSETPIGEIRAARSIQPVIQSMQWFKKIAAGSVLALLILSLWIYGRELLDWLRAVMRGHRGGPDAQLILCPLCGQTADHRASFCHSSYVGDAPIIRISGNGSGADGGPVLRLSEISADPKLTSLKDQMIRQCAEIIKRLAADETSAGRRVREN